MASPTPPENVTNTVLQTDAKIITIDTTLDVPTHHPCFAAHFPGHPIVPGAVLMQWIIGAAKQQGVATKVSAVKSMKFLETLQPGQQCQLEFSVNGQQKTVKVACYRDTTLICRGVLLR